MKISKIIEKKDVFSYLQKRDLIKQYKKTKNYLLSQNFSLINLRKKILKKIKFGILESTNNLEL